MGTCWKPQGTLDTTAEPQLLPERCANCHMLGVMAQRADEQALKAKRQAEVADDARLEAEAACHAAMREASALRVRCNSAEQRRNLARKELEQRRTAHATAASQWEGEVKAWQ